MVGIRVGSYSSSEYLSLTKPWLWGCWVGSPEGGLRLNDVVDDMAMNVGQSAFDTVVIEAESFMIES